MGFAEIGQHLDYVFLLFLRVSGILISSPVFGRSNIPNAYKIGFCVVITGIFIMGLPGPEVFPFYGSLLEYILICIKELLFGAAMGYVLTAMFNITMTAGSIIDSQIGFSLASIYDPQNNTHAPLSGGLLNIMLLIIFFSVDGHLKLIEILYRTLEIVPIGQAVAAPNIAWVSAEVMSRTFVLAVMVAMPVLAAGIFLEVALGVIIRTVPQMNMFVVGIPLKLLIGILALGLTLTVFADFSKTIFNEAFNYIGLMFDNLIQAG
ncbi:MAG TPA: flagellar biosynthetic protein FliR [Clostridiales bacterium]|nr:flagellar biosynthetic protein FliR [Clostridiales bacterium]